MIDKPRLWLDCETSSLDDDRRAWEVAAILRPAGGTRADDAEFSWFVDFNDLDLPQLGDPVSLNVGGFWSRHPQAALVPLTGRLASVEFDGRVPPPAPTFSEREVLERVAELTEGRAVVHGSNPAFDIMTLAPRMSVYGIKPGWHYHPEDVPSTARGWLLGRGYRNAPRKSDLISVVCGINPADYERHSALGDCRWLRDLSDLIEQPSLTDPFAAVTAIAAHARVVADGLDTFAAEGRDDPAQWLRVLRSALDSVDVDEPADLRYGVVNVGAWSALWVEQMDRQSLAEREAAGR
jgi:hypothetical protein